MTLLNILTFGFCFKKNSSIFDISPKIWNSILGCISRIKGKTLLANSKHAFLSYWVIQGEVEHGFGLLSTVEMAFVGVRWSKNSDSSKSLAWLNSRLDFAVAVIW